MAGDLFGVTGATGAVGGRVAIRLAGSSYSQRLIVRDKSRAPDLPGAEAAEASYDDPEAMRRALAGVETLFMVSAAEAADRVRQHIAAVDAAVAAGVERIVYLSFISAAPDATFTFARDHWHTEEHVRATGLRHTFLRDNMYIDFLPGLAGSDGVLLGEGHDGRTYDVTGPEAITLQQVAEELSRVTGRTITYHAETLEEAYASRASYGAPEFEVEGWVTTYTAIAAGEMNVVSDTVHRLTGHEPMTLADFLRRNPENYQHLLPV